MTEKKVSRPKKSTTPEGEKFPRKVIPLKSGPSADEKGRRYANLLTSPELAAHRIIGMLQPKGVADGIDTPTMLETLRDQAVAVQRGDLALAEAMLINQASSLQALFVRLTERAMEQTHMPNLEGYMRMALRAQSQCRATLETLATIKNPPIVYAKQANFANGPQQVNNGAAVGVDSQRSAQARTHAGNIQSEPNKLLEADHGNYLDTRAQGASSRVNPHMATVEAVHRA